jgi:fatty acid desaturase
VEDRVVKFLNEAGWDRIVRVVLGIALLYLGWAGVVTGGWGTFLKIIGFLPLLTGLVGFCPLYAILKIRTNKTAA